MIPSYFVIIIRQVKRNSQDFFHPENESVDIGG